VEEITFTSQHFNIVGELKRPEGKGPHPVVVFVHGDGPNGRTSGGSYPPIMERMLKAGYAAFSWDKPGSGESTGELSRPDLFNQRTRIILDAVEILKKHPSIDRKKIGLWGISQAGYIMPLVLDQSKDIAFIIAVSCPGESGLEQGAYLLATQALHEGLSQEEAGKLEMNIKKVERARTYKTYVENQKKVLRHKDMIKKMGFNVGDIRSEADWEPNDLSGKYFFNPISIIEKITIPVLVFFGERDTQVDPVQGQKAYTKALDKAGNTHYRIELIPGVDHCMMQAETGSLKEIFGRSDEERNNYGPQFLDIVEEWLYELESDNKKTG